MGNKYILVQHPKQLFSGIVDLVAGSDFHNCWPSRWTLGLHAKYMDMKVYTLQQRNIMNTFEVFDTV